MVALYSTGMFKISQSSTTKCESSLLLLAMRLSGERDSATRGKPRRRQESALVRVGGCAGLVRPQPAPPFVSRRAAVAIPVGHAAQLQRAGRDVCEPAAAPGDPLACVARLSRVGTQVAEVAVDELQVFRVGDED